MIDGIIISEQNIIPTDGGPIYHGVKNSDIGFNTFGEVYFSFIDKNALKGWKLHTKMTMNIIVPVGEVRLNFIDDREHSKTLGNEFIINLSEKKNTRLTIPPNLWFAFKGLCEKNMLVNIADIKHDSKEVVTKDINSMVFK